MIENKPRTRRMMAREDFETCITDIFEISKTMFAEEGTVSPALVIFTMGEDHQIARADVVAGEPFFDGTLPTWKEIISKMAIDVVETDLADIACIVSEAWIVSKAYSAEELKNIKGLLANHPDRQEVVIVAFFSADYQNLAMFDMDRTNKTLTCRPIKWAGKAGGRMCRNEKPKH